MTKKLSLTLTASALVLGLTTFSISNAFALDPVATTPEPLASAKQICKELKASYFKDLANAKAKGLSSQMSKEDLAQWLKDIKDMKNTACKEAKTEGLPLTSAVQLCKEAQKNYYKNMKDMKAKGLSQQMTKEQLKIELDEIKNYKKKICAEAKTNK